MRGGRPEIRRKERKMVSKFKELFYESLSSLQDEYWKDPGTNSVGGVEQPGDRERNEWILQAFNEAATRLGCRVEHHRNEDDDCYHLVKWIAVHPDEGKIAGVRFIDCVCGDHGPRNVILITKNDKEVWKGFIRGL